MNAICHNFIKLLLLAVFLIPVGCSSSTPPEIVFIKRIPWISRGEWIKVDTHIHTKFSDGAHSVSELAQKARFYGCDAIAITDHADKNRKAATPEYEEAIKVARREFPDMIIIAGLEWNVPPWGGDVHATVLFPQTDNEWGDLAQFKRFFDDHGRSEHEKDRRVEALHWLKKIGEHSKAPPVVILNHPGRKADSNNEVAEMIRDWKKDDDLLIGFSGAPGHQAMQPLGAFNELLTLQDRWDPSAAVIGNAWDTLLQEGFDIYAARAASDFHSHKENRRNGYDYWPGEFSETWLYVPSRTTDGVLKAFRAGSFFANHGHIVRQVSLTVSTPALGRPGYAGETIELPEGAHVDVNLTFQTPVTDWQGNRNKIDEIEIIAITKSGSNVIAKGAPNHNQFSTTITIPKEGTVIRARGRNINPVGDDLMFYTNPIRIVTSGSIESSSNSIDGWVPFLILIPLIVVAFLSYRFFTQKTKKVTTSPSQSKKKQVVTTLYKPRPDELFSLKLPFAILSFLLAGFIVYGSLLPFRYEAISFSEAFPKYRHILFEATGRTGRIDFLTNILLYFPLSFFLSEICLRKSSTVVGTILKTTAIFLCCVCFSVSVEFAQIWYSTDRVPSRFDVLANSLGSFAGILFWFLTGSRIQKLLSSVFSQKPWQSKLNSFLIAYMLIVFLISILPLDLSINPVELFEKYQKGRIQPIPFQDVESAGDLMKKFLFHLLLFAPVGILNTIRLRIRGYRPSAYVQASLLQGFLFVSITELSQVLVLKRYALATDVIMGTIAVFIGSMIVYGSRQPELASKTQKTLPRQWVWFSFAMLYLIVPFIYYWFPFQLEENTALLKENVSEFFVLPFARLQRGSNMRAYGNLLHSIFFLIPFGILLAIYSSVQTQGLLSKKSRLIFSTILIVLIAFILEWGHLFLKDRISDITSVLISITGGLIGLFQTYWFISRSVGSSPTSARTSPSHSNVSSR